MRNSEQEIDLSLFEDMERNEVLGYVEGKYSKEVAQEIMELVDKIIQE